MPLAPPVTRATLPLRSNGLVARSVKRSSYRMHVSFELGRPRWQLHSVGRIGRNASAGPLRTNREAGWLRSAAALRFENPLRRGRILNQFLRGPPRARHQLAATIRAVARED